MKRRCSVHKHGWKVILGDQQGAVLIWVGLSMVMLLGFTALAVDGSYLYLIRNQLQVTADAAASAGVHELPDPDAARTTAADYAGKNMTAADHGTVLADADIVVGNWDFIARIDIDTSCPSDV